MNTDAGSTAGTEKKEEKKAEESNAETTKNVNTDAGNTDDKEKKEEKAAENDNNGAGTEKKEEKIKYEKSKIGDSFKEIAKNLLACINNKTIEVLKNDKTIEELKDNEDFKKDLKNLKERINVDVSKDKYNEIFLSIDGSAKLSKETIDNIYNAEKTIRYKTKKKNRKKEPTKYFMDINSLAICGVRVSSKAQLAIVTRKSCWEPSKENGFTNEDLHKLLDLADALNV